MLIRTSKSKEHRKIQVANDKLIKNHLNCRKYIIRYKETYKKTKYRVIW